MVSHDAADRFRAAPWLADLDAASREAVLQVLVESRVAPGTVLLEQGRPNDHITFLIEGAVAITRAAPDGRVEPVTTLPAPTAFGLTSFFRPHPPNVTARAVGAAWLLTLDHPAHDLLRRVDPRAAEQLALAVARVLADRFDLLIEQVSRDMAQHPADDPKATEWARFRARLFDEANI